MANEFFISSVWYYWGVVKSWQWSSRGWACQSVELEASINGSRKCKQLELGQHRRGSAQLWTLQYEEEWRIVDSTCKPRYQPGEITGGSGLLAFSEYISATILCLTFKYKTCLMKGSLQAWHAYVAARYTDRLTLCMTMFSSSWRNGKKTTNECIVH